MKKTGFLFAFLIVGLVKIHGQSWDTISLIANNRGAYNGITFVNDNHGFIIGDSNTFLETKDAGKTWLARTPIEDTPRRKWNRDHKQIIFLNDTLGFLTNNYELFQTKDAGETWEVSITNNGGVKSFNLFNGELTVFSDEGFGTLLISVYSEEYDTFSYQGGGFFPVYTLDKIIRLNDSIMVVGKDTGKLFIYNRKDKTITKTYDPANDGLTNLHVSDLYFLNKDTGFASFNYIILKKTTDGGKSWFTDTTINNTPATTGATKVFSWANGALYLNSANFATTNFIHKYNRKLSLWEYETGFKDNDLRFGYDNFSGIAGNGRGLFTVFEKDILGYKTEWNYIKSISKAAENQLKVYPNPSNGRIYIENTSSSQSSFCRVFDAKGKQIEMVTINSSNSELVIKKKGIYFITLEQGGIILGHSKIIIQ